MIGRCYVRGNDLKYDPADFQWQSYNEVCDPRDDQNSEGMCLAGMSAAITQTEIFLGAPGCFNWQGEGTLFSCKHLASTCKNDIKLSSNHFPSYAGNTFSQWYNPEDTFDYVKSKLPNKNRGNIYIGKAVLRPFEQVFETTATTQTTKNNFSWCISIIYFRAVKSINHD